MSLLFGVLLMAIVAACTIFNQAFQTLLKLGCLGSQWHQREHQHCAIRPPSSTRDQIIILQCPVFIL